MSNCLPLGFYGPISSVNGFYKPLQHMLSLHTVNQGLEKHGIPLLLINHKNFCCLLIFAAVFIDILMLIVV